MESSMTVKAVKAEHLRLQDKLIDDWVQPFACNHVVVNFTPERKPGKKSKDSKKTKGDKSSYCIMCGEQVVENECEESQISSLDELRDEKRKGVGSESPKPDFGSFRKLSSAMSNVTTTSTRACTIHGHKTVKYFCEDHQEICCSVCVNVLHRGCQRIMLIKDEIQTGWSDQICEDTIAALEAISKSFEHILGRNDDLRKKLSSQVEEFRKRRDDFKAHIINLLDDFVKRSEKKLKKFITIAENEIAATEETCKDVIQEANANIGILEQSLKSSSKNDTFIATQKVLHQRSKYGVALFNAINGSKEVFIDLIPETNIQNLEELRKIGKIQFVAENVTFPESVISAVSKIPKSEIRSPRTARDARSESTSSLKDPVSLLGEFNVRLPEDKNRCENVGATFLKDGRIAIVDLKNRKLKVSDAKFSQVCAVALTSDPRAVTEVSPHEVAVTLPDESKIQFISTGKKLQKTRSILTSMPCYGITCHNQDLVVLCDDGFSTTAVQTIDFEGKVLKTVKTNRSGKVLLKNPWNLSVSVDGRQMCVTDKGRLVNFDQKGNILFQYMNDQLDDPRGLVADETGKFYVCGTGSNNVHQLSADGKLIDVVLTDENITAPQAVCYNVAKRMLLLTCVGNDNVFLYKLAKP